MDKEKYIKIGIKKKLPSRCPILDYCQRRAQTIYIFGEYKEENRTNNYIKTLIDAGELKADYLENEIKISGELPSFTKGNKYGHFTNMCPEVSMFDEHHSIPHFKNLPCSSGKWDNQEKQNITIIEEKHYSECLEFSTYLVNNIKSKNISKNENNVKDCFTYLMIDLNTGHHKIGMSYSPEFREKTLQSEKPDIVTVYTRKFTNRKLAKDFEVELHKKYVHKRVRGEWFDLDSIEINEIIKLMRI